MATIEREVNEMSSFDKEVSKSEGQVETIFDELISTLIRRKNFILTRIRNLQKTDCLIQESRETELSNGAQISDNNKRILFDFDTTIPEKLCNFGGISVVEIRETSVPVAEYEDKVDPVVTVGGVPSSADGEFYCPIGVAVDYASECIYVADHLNHRVQVFNGIGDYLFRFGDNNGPVKMLLPVCIAIFQNKVYVSQQGLSCLLVYNLDGGFMCQIGIQGTGKGNFNDPRGLTFNEYTGDIYVCDHLNHRILIFSDYAISTLGEGLLNSPVAVCVTKHSIFVLTTTEPFLFEFDYSSRTNLHSEVISTVSKYIQFSYSFCIDGAGRFLLADNQKNCVTIVDQDGKLIHSLHVGISKPMSVTINTNGDILVAGYNHSLLIF